MGTTTCKGVYKSHEETVTCDGCTGCPRCVSVEVRFVRLSGCACCGELLACPSCAARLARHILEHPDPRCAIPAEVHRLARQPADQAEVLRRYPALVAHMICESLGYFTPGAAANAILCYVRGLPFFCEYYTHLAGGFDHAKVRAVGREVIERAYRTRRHHRGYMAHYPHARALVDHVNAGGEGPILASWF